MKRKEPIKYEQQPKDFSTVTEGGKILREQMLERTLPPQQLSKMSYNEFLASADEDRPAEWVDGEVILMSPASQKHQDIAGFLAALLRFFVESRELGKVMIPPFQMKMERGREPDLLFIANDHLARLKSNHLDGPADLVVEIVSPESIERDRIDKYQEYERGGVREFWLIDPEQMRTEFFVLGEDGRYDSLSATDGTLHSLVLPGFWLKVEWLWMEPLPKLHEVLMALDIL